MPLPGGAQPIDIAAGGSGAGVQVWATDANGHLYVSTSHGSFKTVSTPPGDVALLHVSLDAKLKLWGTTSAGAYYVRDPHDGWSPVQNGSIVDVGGGPAPSSGVWPMFGVAPQSGNVYQVFVNGDPQQVDGVTASQRVASTALSKPVVVSNGWLAQLH
jgi:hypothetical protein